MGSADGRGDEWVGPRGCGWGHCAMELPSHAALVEGNVATEMFCLVAMVTMHLLLHVPQYYSRTFTVELLKLLVMEE